MCVCGNEIGFYTLSNTNYEMNVAMLNNSFIIYIYAIQYTISMGSLK